VSREGRAKTQGCAFLFPGQGAQRVGMGLDVARRYAEARSVFERADAVLGMPLSRLCFEGPEAELKRTENLQPALLTVEVATSAVLEAHGVKPVACAGLSLGEYSALVAAGSLSFEDAVVLVRKRGLFMQEAVPEGEGAMAAVLGLSDEEVVALCEEVDGVVAPVNFNGPGQVVISGRAAPVERAARRALDRGARRVVTLPVSAPFHSSLMRSAARRLAHELRASRIADPLVPVVANVDGRARTDAAGVREALVRQVDSPVRWTDCFRTLLGMRVRTFVEVGPGESLKGFARRIDRRALVLCAGDLESLEEVLDNHREVC